jgi:CO/xanthine dehydrogenase Mo-binding subunit
VSADIGAPIERVDAAEKAAGTALYVADLPFPGLLHGRMIRSTKPRARILSVRYPERWQERHPHA